jgi:hypothetical protein
MSTENTNNHKMVSLAGAFVSEYLSIKKSQEGDNLQDELRNFFAIRNAIQAQLDRMTREISLHVPLPEEIDVYTITPEYVIALAHKKGMVVLIHDGVMTLSDNLLVNCVVRQFTDSPPEQLLEAVDWLNTLESEKE